MNRASIAGIVICMLTTSLIAAEPEQLQPLFDGKSIDGWIQRGGKATYTVEDGCIVGKCVPNTPNSFLCPPKDYADFILEYEYNVDPSLNSGVQIRSHSRPEYKDGQVHGYQVEIDMDAKKDRWWSAGVFEEAKRGWLFPQKGNKDQETSFTDQGRKVSKKDDWNLVRVEAVGSQIKTWLNGELRADLKDDTEASGFIGFQVHSVGKSDKPMSIKWRNIKIKELTAQSATPVNTLTEQEQKDGWILLFDGKTSTGWKSAKGDSFPQIGWEIKDGLITVLGSEGKESASGGDIITTKKYSNFILDVDFRLTEGANSGIKYFVDPEINKGPGSSIGLEFQILDDVKHPDAKMGKNGNRTIASLYDLIPAASTKKPSAIGEWNHGRVVSNGKHVEHWLNGEKVVEYERGSPEYRELVAGSKYKKFKDFGELPEGNILLQDHGNTVSFRNIKIKPLNVK